MSEEDIMKLLEDFNVHHELTTIGVCASNWAVTTNYVQNTKSLFGEVSTSPAKTNRQLTITIDQPAAS